MHEGLDLFEGRWDAEEIEARAADECPATCLGRRIDACGFELREDKSIDRRLDPLATLRLPELWHARSDERMEGPGQRILAFTCRRQRGKREKDDE